MTSCFKKAGNDAIGYTAWPWHFTKPWNNIFEHGTPDQLNCFGCPEAQYPHMSNVGSGAKKLFATMAMQ